MGTRVGELARPSIRRNAFAALLSLLHLAGNNEREIPRPESSSVSLRGFARAGNVLKRSGSIAPQLARSRGAHRAHSHVRYARRA
ncbi:unnamed protein product [Lampetra fluviatilis]